MSWSAAHPLMMTLLHHSRSHCFWKSRGSRHSSRPSKMNTTLTSSPSKLLISFSCG
uniref:Uncharacterized protein n=2 Tax=Anguilla anguilla TaxID=7936 RepID=A0A0E9UH98_ANGAN